MQQWWHEVVELVHAGKRREAISLTRDAANAGSLAARARLAIFGEEAGLTREEADRVLAEVEQAMADDDETSHWVLRGAYDMLLGNIEFEERSRMVLRHLEAFARLTADPIAIYAVAVNYAHGRIGVSPSVEQATEWFYYAAALGHPEAKRAIRRIHDA